MDLISLLFYAFAGLLVLSGIRIVAPMERGVIERFGKYNRFASPGFNYAVPLVETIRRINITEQMVDAEPQEVITMDNLNARVNAQIYFKVNEDEESVKRSQYSVYDYQIQIVSLARTTLRDKIGTMKFTDVNSNRGELNRRLQDALNKETAAWGINIVRAELMEIDPPKDVQDAMNKVLIAEKEKEAAIDFATATETRADGERRARIKEAEGMKQSEILVAEGKKQATILDAEAQAIYIKDVNEAAQKYFKDDAQTFKKLNVISEALRNNAKIVLPSDKQLINVIGDMAGVTPVPIREEEQAERKERKAAK